MASLPRSVIPDDPIVTETMLNLNEAERLLDKAVYDLAQKLPAEVISEIVAAAGAIAPCFSLSQPKQRFP